MASVNKVILIGYLGTDPEVKTTQSGKSVGEMRLATSFGTGEMEKTEWHRVVLWEKLAETAGKYLKKGSQVYVEGRIQSRQYEDKEGVTKYITEVVADRLTMLGGKLTDSVKEDPDAGGQIAKPRTKSGRKAKQPVDAPALEQPEPPF